MLVMGAHGVHSKTVIMVSGPSASSELQFYTKFIPKFLHVPPPFKDLFWKMQIQKSNFRKGYMKNVILFILKAKIHSCRQGQEPGSE